MEQAHSDERSLCDLLEGIADELPSTLNRLVAVPAVDMLRCNLAVHRALQERYLLPALVIRARADDQASLLKEQIEVEHAADEMLAHNVADHLETAVNSNGVENPGMLGYMLYAYFESRRRHLAWEEAVLLPLAKRYLKPADWQAFPLAEFECEMGRSAINLDKGQGGCTCGGEDKEGRC